MPKIAFLVITFKKESSRQNILYGLGPSYSKIKGLEVDSFKKQLEFFTSNRSVVSTSNVLNCMKG